MKRTFLGLFYILFAVCVMTIVDGFIQPHYAVKSGIKLILFGLIPFTYLYKRSRQQIKAMFTLNKTSLLPSFALGISLYFIIVVGYLLVSRFIDFSNITGSLNDAMQVNASNFIFVALYISFINSLLEEFFFRGFALEALQGYYKKVAIFLSAFLFAIYHVAMMIGWYQLYVFSLAIIALFLVGILFIWLNQKFNTIYTSWIVHLFCNLGINTVGLFLFNIL